MINNALLNEFPQATPEQWREAAEKLLKGAPFEKVMTRMTPEGIRLEPIFWKGILDELPSAETRPGFDGYLRGTKATGYREEPWEIAQELPFGTPEAFNAAAKADLMRGQTALNVILDIATLKGQDPDSASPGEVGACGLSLACLEDFRTAFEGIHPEAIGFHIRTGCSGLTTSALFFAWLKEIGVDPKSVKGSFGMDPIAVQAAAGTLPAKLETLLEELSQLAAFCAKNAPDMRAVGVSTLPYHQAGAASTEELGIALATATAYLEAMTADGLSIDEAASQIRFSFAIGPNFFMEIAKLRAARVLWAQVVSKFGGNAESQKIKMHARTGLYNKTRKDPYVNMLRTTTEALSGVIGGVDSLCVGNFDEVSRLPDTFSRRISRNTQVILQEECELTAVADPAGGSWAIEWLTGQVSEKAWTFFQDIESAGGINEALAQGIIFERIAATAKENEKQLNQRRLSLVGTNVYPNLEEVELEPKFPDYAQIRNQRAREIAANRLSLSEEKDRSVMQALGAIADARTKDRFDLIIEAVNHGATVGEITRILRNDGGPIENIRPLPAKRLASRYEAMREASAHFAKSSGRAPTIFLTNLGPLRNHKLRADFTKGFFQTGGFEIISSKGFTTPEEAVSELAQSEAGITVICGTDADYAEQFPAFAAAIKAAIPEMQIVLAGFPGENEATYRAAGMDDYIFVKSDNFATNERYLKGLGVL